jgi:DNA replication protein DnaC
MTTDAVTDVRIATYAKALKLPVVARQFKSVAQDAEAEGRSYLDFLAALLEQEVLQREQNGVHLRIQQARFPYVKTLDAFDFTAVPGLNKAKVLALTHCEWVGQHDNVLLVGNAGTGKTHLGIALGIAACRAGKRVRFYTAASLVNELIAAQQEGSLHRLQRAWRRWDLVVLDELGYIPFSATGSQLLFNFCSERYERGSLLITSNLEFARWTEVFGDENLTAALLDRLTHKAHILPMNGESYRFRESIRRQQS